MKDSEKAGYDLWMNESTKFNDTHDFQLTLGKATSNQLLNDSKRQLFVLSRYKFAAKMIGDEKRSRTLEFGCGEGLGSLLLNQVSKNVLAIDFDAARIKWCQEQLKVENLEFRCESFIGKKYGKFDSIVSLDVIEHIHPELEDDFFSTVRNNLTDNGILILGTPNKTASQYASPESQIGHINMYDAQGLKQAAEKNFNNVFLFGANDEVIHTGFAPMCHYLMVLACNPKK